MPLYVNPLAVVVAAVASFILGALWFSPVLFARPWLAESGLTPESYLAAKPRMPVMYGIAFGTALIAAFAMARFLVTQDHHSLVIGLKRGFGAGTCFVAMAFASNYAFELRSARHWTITAGYYVVQYTVMGMILGVMNN